MKSVFYTLVFFSAWLQSYAGSPMVNYRSQPNNFVSEFALCARDELCYFYFWHIAKSGGTTITNIFYKTFSIHPFESGCCRGRMMERFKENTNTYCRKKFLTYQVTGRQMREVVQTCTKLQPDSRAVLFVVMREPISKFISSVGQLCNKMLSHIDEDWLKVCDRCAYVPDTEATLNKQIKVSNKIYTDISKIIEMDIQNVQVLLLDTVYINRMVETLGIDLQPDFNVTLRYRNIAITSPCDFGATSAVVKLLAPSVMIYHNISLDGGLN